MNSVPGLILVLALLGALLGIAGTARHRRWLTPEGARKTVHLGMGLTCLTFPLLFTDPWPVWLLALLACASLLAVRQAPALRRQWGRALHDVERVSWGELCFPLGVATVFTLAPRHSPLYAAPVLLLTLADAAGALVGQRWGRLRFRTLDGEKSAEGSAAVAVTGFACVSLCLALAGEPPATVLLIGAITGLFAALLEAVSWRGLDNLFLPLAAYTQIAIYLEEDTATLVLKLTVLCALVVTGLLWRRGQVADDSARLGAALACYFFWVVGGWTWLLPPLVLLGSYVRLPPRPAAAPPQHNLLAVLSLSSSGLPWAVAAAADPAPIWTSLFILGLATHQAVITLVRTAQARPGLPRVSLWAYAVATTLTLQGPLLAWTLPSGTHALSAFASASACLGVALALFLWAEPRLAQPASLTARWWKQSLAALLASGSAALIFHLYHP